MAPYNRARGCFPRDEFVSFIVAAVGVGAVLALYVFVPALTTTPLILFVVVVAAAALYGGFRSALGAALLAAAVADYYVLPPVGKFSTEPHTLAAMGAFLATSIIVAWLAGSRRRDRGRAAANEARFQSIRDLLPEGFCILRPVFAEGDERIEDYEFEFVNPAAARLLKRPGLAGKRLLEELPGLLEHPELLEQSARLLKTGFFEPAEFHYCADGIEGWFRVAAVRLEGRIALSLNEITERKQAEEVLRRYELLAYHTRDIVLFMNSEDGHLLEANAAAVEAYGYAREELLGLTINDLRTTETKGLTQAQMHTAREQGLSFETVHRRRDGSTFPVEVSSQGARIGGMHTLISVVRDISSRKRGEERLRENEERLRAIFDHAGVGIVEVANDDRFIAVNDRACEILGRRREELLRMNVHELTWPEDRGISDRLNAELHEGLRDRIDYEKRYAKGNGAYVWAHVTVSAIRDDAGRWVRSITTIQDITGRKQAEDALRKGEAKMRAVFHALVEGVVFLNPQGEVEEVNDAVSRTHGHTLEELTDFRSDPRGLIVRPDGTPFPVDEQPAIVALRTGRAVRDVEMGVPVSNGELRWRLVNAQPVCDDQGNLLGAVASFFDISDRRRVEQALRESEERYRTLFNSIDEGFCVFELILDSTGAAVDWVYLEANPAFERQTGWPCPVGKKVSELEPNLEPHWFRAFGQVAATGEPIRFVQDAAAMNRCYDVYAFRVGEVGSLKVSLLFNDVTERRHNEEALRKFAQTLEGRVAERTAELERTHEALRQSERLATLGQAMAVLSHENRNALQNTLAALHMLRRTVGENEKQLRYIEGALKALDGLRHTYEDIRQYAAEMKLETEKRSLADVWRETWTDLASRLMERDVNLTESWNSHGCMCEMDPARIRQVFRNLIENSLDACPDPVDIHVVCEETDLDSRPALRMAIRDNGPGLTETDAKHVLEPFFTTKAKGTGVGLAIVRRIVEAHGGRIAVYTREGEGFEVVIELPK